MRTYPPITCVGETIIDFFATNLSPSLSEASSFVRRPGGAAANVCVGIRKMGVGSAFVGAVGPDGFGIYLRRELARQGVDVSGMVCAEGFRTRLAFVSVSKRGERDFDFWESMPADTRLTFSRTMMKTLFRSRIVHFSSFLLLAEPARSGALGAVRHLAQAGPLISFDPNLRLSLWKSRHEARTLHLRMIKNCHLLRLNDSEARFLSRTKSLSSAVSLFHHLGPSVVVVTLGEEGCYCSTPRGTLYAPAFRVRTVDTTGCGDAFLAGFLSGIVLENKLLDHIDLPSWFAICRRANAAGALTAMKPGGMSAMPVARQLQTFMEKHRP